MMETFKKYYKRGEFDVTCHSVDFCIGMLCSCVIREGLLSCGQVVAFLSNQSETFILYPVT